MSKDNEAVVRAFYEAWVRRDFAAAAAMCTEDVRSTQHMICVDGIPFSVVSTGRAVFESRMANMTRDLEMAEAVLIVVSSFSTEVRTITSYKIRRPSSGEIYEGALNQSWRVINGKIASTDVSIDAAATRALLGAPPQKMPIH